ncbi:Ig-like domain-containing protein [Mitsuaria sp. CC2]
MNQPLHRAKPARKRKPGEGGDESLPVAKAAADAGQESPPAAMVEDGPDGRGLETVEGLIGLVGVGVAGVVAAGLRGGSGGGEIAPTGDVVVARPVSPPATGTLIPETREPAVTLPKIPMTKSPDPVEGVGTRGPGTQVPGIVDPTVEPKIEPKVEPKIVPPIEVDTTPPARPTLALKRDTGSDANDGVTSDSTITVSGLEQGASWRYSLDGGKTWHVGHGSEISDIRFDGDHKVQVDQTDQAGNVSDATSLTFTLDTGAPRLSLKNDTARTRYDGASGTEVAVDGSHKHDGITKDGTLSVSGLNEAAIWQFSLDEGRSWRVGDGNEIPARELGADGQKTVWVKQQSGDKDSGLSSFSFVLDTEVKPVVPRLKSSEGTDERGVPFSTDPVIVFDGFEQGNSMSWVMYGGRAGQTEEPNSHSMSGDSFELPLKTDWRPFPMHIREATQTDVAGNASESSALFSFDFRRPEMPAPTLGLLPPDTIFP